jgi:hypothetical protein
VRRVSIAVARRTGSTCRYLHADGRFAARPTGCARPTYLATRGFRTAAFTGTWSFTTKHPLPRGRYDIWVRATDTRGNVEPRQRRRNGLQLRLR